MNMEKKSVENFIKYGSEGNNSSKLQEEFEQYR